MSISPALRSRSEVETGVLLELAGHQPRQNPIIVPGSARMPPHGNKVDE